jgi:hypothetical protein
MRIWSNASIGKPLGLAAVFSISGDNPVAALAQEDHLVFPGIRAERPAMAENYGLSLASVLIVQINVFGIFLTDTNIWHGNPPCCACIDHTEEGIASHMV